MLGCWVRLGLRSRLLRIHMLSRARLGRWQYLGSQCLSYHIKSLHIYMESLISEFSHIRKLVYIFLLSHLRNIRNLEYTGQFQVILITLFWNIYLRERFKFQDIIINSYVLYKFTPVPKIFSLWMLSLFPLCHFGTYVKHLQDSCKYFIWNVSNLHNNSAKILNRKSLILLWINGHVTPNSWKH
jgi:hypothetical protein